MRKSIDRILVFLLIILMITMVLSTLLQVAARVIEINVPFTEELTIYSMMWVAFLGSTYVFGLKKHITIDVLSSSIKKENKWRLEILVEFIIIIFAFLILIIGGVRFVYITIKLEQLSSVMQIPKGLIYLVLPLSGTLTIVYNFLNIMDSIKKIKT